MLKPGQAAEHIGVTTETLRRWRKHGEGPPFVKLSTGRVRYPADELVRYLEQRTVTRARGRA